MRKLPLKKYLETAKYLWANYRSNGDGVIYPFYASLKVTKRCNFKCKFCNVWKEEQKELNTDDMKRLLDVIGDSSIFLLSFEGGEPLLRDDIEELLAYIHTKPVYLLFTTSERDLLNKYHIDRLCKYIDFLHISIDEGHKNIEMFENLKEYTNWGSIVCVQTVVTDDSIDNLEWKVKKCYDSNSKIVIMPATHLENTKNYFPEFNKFKKEVLRLKKDFPETIITPEYFFKAMEKPNGCTTSSIIIDSDGGLFYPCRTLTNKPVNLLETPLNEFLISNEAKECRKIMKNCNKKCGWYQYFATASFTSINDIWGAIRPYMKQII